MTTETFDCPIAKSSVVWSMEIQIVRDGFPPVPRFRGCTGLSSCGVEVRHSGGSTFNWDVCPKAKSLNG